MKITVEQLRKVIKEEVQKVVREMHVPNLDIGFDVNKTFKADPVEIAEHIVDIVGAGYTNDFLRVAGVVKKYAGLVRDARHSSYDEVTEEDAKIDISKALERVVFSAGKYEGKRVADLPGGTFKVTQEIILAFLDDADWTR